MSTNLRCLVYINTINSKNTLKGQSKLCSTASVKNMCKCKNCKFFVSEKQKVYRKNNLKKIKEYQKEYREKNINKKKVRVIKDLVVYRQKRKEYNDRYKTKNAEKIKEIWRQKDRNRRAKIKENGYEKYTENQVLEKYGSNCYICNKEINLTCTRLIGKPGWEQSLHIEHYIDIALGGPDTLENVRPSHAICNLTKNPRGMV
jgi:hypothetical protein